MSTTLHEEHAGKEASTKSYAVAVCLSGIFGVVGIHHFYLGRHLEGLADVAMTIGWVYGFATENIALALLFLAADMLHTFIVTIMLLTGSFRDGRGRYITYPGQVLR
jgi:TM2 domain-containing membrane protein YozV